MFRSLVYEGFAKLKEIASNFVDRIFCCKETLFIEIEKAGYTRRTIIVGEKYSSGEHKLEGEALAAERIYDIVRVGGNR